MGEVDSQDVVALTILGAACSRPLIHVSFEAGLPLDQKVNLKANWICLGL